MPRFERANAIDREKAESAISRLRLAIQEIERLRDWFACHPETQELWIFRMQSLDGGLNRIESFLPEIMRSLTASAKGQPFTAETDKKRKPTKFDRELEDVARKVIAIEKRDSERTAAKKSAKKKAKGGPDGKGKATG